ncbi:hypothetical protein GGR13_000812 [Brevundimonas variabilis]|uniref:Uncharacterized protein n=1 Tax=Brevundimonas variabilis TaxID=74312 RepID=A0A7W9FDH9_9CAUL|nr:hypothetical protein [Brevundimonas variabilis]
MSEYIRKSSRQDLGNQGQTWEQISKVPPFQRPKPIFDRPMEITVGMLRGLRMVDETVIVYGGPPKQAREN